MKHKHYDCIVAWAEGKEIQFKGDHYGGWITVLGAASWSESNEYRIKPEPKPDVVVFVPVIDFRLYRTEQRDGDNLRLTFDGETGKLKTAEVI
jgi:hypothetical protein